MSRRWSMRLTRVSLTLLLGALPGLTPTPVTAQAPASPAVPTDPHGALPESYPWVRLAEQLMPAVVNVRTVAEALVLGLQIGKFRTWHGDS